MTTQIIQNKRIRIPNGPSGCRILFWSSFGLWAALLGLSPVLAIHLLMGT